MDHSAIRHRMLDGEWQDDGDLMLRNHIGNDRREGWGVLDMSACPAKQIAGELAVLYIGRPTVSCAFAGFEDLASDTGMLRQAGLWTKMKELQRYCWFLRDYYMRIDIDVVRRAFTFRLVSPHDVIAKSRNDEPDRPVRLEELRLRDFVEPNGDVCAYWTWDVLDISDPENPTYTVQRVNHTKNGELEDVTQDVLGGDFSGKNYPYKTTDGAALLPYVLYHARDTGKLSNAYDGVEVMIGSLNAGVYWTMAGHAAKDASGRSVIVVGAELAGVETKHSASTGAPIRSIVLEPGIMYSLEPTGNGTVVVQEIGPGAQVAALEEFATRYERRIAIMAGINPSDIQRLGGDARSGYAIAISNQGKRVAQEEQTEIYRRYDIELVEKCACIANRLLGTVFPERGYGIEYKPIPKTPEEEQAERDQIEFDLSHGFISPAEALLRRRPALTQAQAEEILRQNAQQVAMIRVQSGQMTANQQQTGTGLRFAS